MYFKANEPIRVFTHHKIKTVVDGDGMIVYNIFNKNTFYAQRYPLHHNGHIDINMLWQIKPFDSTVYLIKYIDLLQLIHHS